MLGIASETKMEKICQVATKIKKFLLADDKSLAVRFSVESQTIHISRDSVSVKVNDAVVYTGLFNELVPIFQKRRRSVILTSRQR